MKSKQTTSLIVKAIMLLLALIVMVFVATLAWFSNVSEPKSATGVQAKTIGVAEFEMAVGFKTSQNGYKYVISDYEKTLNFRSLKFGATRKDALHDFSPIDVTGDGVTLIRPTLKNKNLEIDRNSNVYNTVTPNKEYISVDMYFRSNDPCSVYLDKDSYAIGKCELNPDGTINEDGLLTDTERKSSYGDFSKDAVVGAIRVSFVEYDRVIEEEDYDHRATTPTALWLPRPDIYLESNATSSGWVLHTDAVPNQYIVGEGDLARDTYTHHYYAFAENSEGKIVGTDFNYENTVTQTNKDVICVVDEIHTDGYYYGKTQVNIWVEGCDTEARRAISGGQFLVNFDLRGG
ncbi:MAG: hypothetical protein IJO20_08965 [Ruminococcus sp.]|nr:hypothetical protein [Ruminococcus sp.]MBQ7134605.1 hypothetical protein [Ruminococcus sp.]